MGSARCRPHTHTHAHTPARCAVLDGAVALTAPRADRSGEFGVVQIISRNGTVGELSLLLRSPYHLLTARALRRCALMCVPRAAYMEAWKGKLDEVTVRQLRRLNHFNFLKVRPRTADATSAA